MSSPATIPAVESLSTRIRVGAWTVFPDLRRMQSGDEIVRLSPKAMAVLLQLAGRQGHVVTRNELLATVWNGTLPTDDVLTHAIVELRRVFGDDRTAPEYIETIPKTGYRLIAPVSREPEADSGSTSSRNDAMRRAALWIVAIVLTTSAILLAMNPSGTAPEVAYSALELGAKPVTSEPGRQGQPAISPGGDRIAYIAHSPDDGSYDLFVRGDAATPGLRMTSTEHDDYAPVWSPDGSRIAFIRFDDAKCRVLVLPATGGEPRDLANCPAGGVTSIDWSPDGGWIAYSWFRDGEDNVSVHEVSVETGRVRAIAYETSPPHHDIHPRYSPHGDRIAFQRKFEHFSETYVMPRIGGEAKPVTQFRGSLSGLDWWVDGASLVVSSDHGGLRGLWRIRLDDLRTEFMGFGGARFPSTSTDGASFVFETSTESSNLTSLNLDASTTDLGPQSIHPSTRRESSPRFSPDGRQLLFVSDRTGSAQLWLAAGDRLRQVTHFAAGDVSGPAWHPDGKRAAYVFRKEGRGGVFLVDVETGKSHRLVDASFDALSAAFSSDGRRVFFSAHGNGEWRIWVMDMEGGDNGSFPVTDAHSLAAGPAGRYLYYSKLQGDGLWRMSLDDRSSERVSKQVTFWNRAAWEIVGESIYYLDMASGSTTLEIHRLDLATLDSSRVSGIPFSLAELSLTVSPDRGRTVLVADGLDESDVMVTHLD